MSVTSGTWHNQKLRQEAAICFILMSGKSKQIAGRVSLLIVHLNLGVLPITVESSMMGKHFSRRAF
jgi:hypothetical protein